MGLGKQAKVLSPAQQHAMLAYIDSTRWPLRNRVIFLLSVKAGLRAKEIAHLTWGMVTDASGSVAEGISLQDKASKGRSGGYIPFNKDLKNAIIAYQASLKGFAIDDRVVQSERMSNVSAQIIINLFSRWYKNMGFTGCSSHSGRRTFITGLAKKISYTGGSIRDVQALARHSSLAMTQRYIDTDVEAQMKVVQLI